MWRRILPSMREKVRQFRLITSDHANQALADDDLLIDDIENAILTGRVVGRQKDREAPGWKHVLRGSTLSGQRVEVILKFGTAGNLLVVTVYLL